MLDKRIKYFSYRGCADPERRRDNSPAADTKIDYIIEVLNRCGYGVDHISKAGSSIDKFIPGYVERKGENTYRYFASFKKTESILRLVFRWFMDLQFFCWCLFNIRRGETILVYHSLGYDSAFIKLKRIKKFTLIGDIEEIYQDVHPQSKCRSRNEYDFIELSDKFMFPNTLLNRRLNKNIRPHLVVHGIYKTKPNIAQPFNDGYIHLLYAGTFDPVKGGANAAIMSTKYLSSKYHLHICGFGSESQIKDIKSNIEKIKLETECLITFHGYLSNEENINLMQKCDVGLCTQDLNSLLNLTSFPSKILNYMANGLAVVSGRNAAIEESYVGDLVYYYDRQEPEEIAKAILDVVPNRASCKERLEKLDRDFEKNIKTLLNGGLSSK